MPSTTARKTTTITGTVVAADQYASSRAHRLTGLTIDTADGEVMVFVSGTQHSDVPVVGTVVRINGATNYDPETYAHQTVDGVVRPSADAQAARVRVLVPNAEGLEWQTDVRLADYLTTVSGSAWIRDDAQLSTGSHNERTRKVLDAQLRRLPFVCEALGDARQARIYRMALILWDDGFMERMAGGIVNAYLRAGADWDDALSLAEALEH